MGQLFKRHCTVYSFPNPLGPCASSVQGLLLQSPGHCLLVNQFNPENIMKLPEIHRPVIRCEPEEPDMSGDTPGPVQALTELFLSGAFPPEFLASMSGHLDPPSALWPAPRLLRCRPLVGAEALSTIIVTRSTMEMEEALRLCEFSDETNSRPIFSHTKCYCSPFYPLWRFEF